MTIFDQLRSQSDKPLSARSLEQALTRLIVEGGLSAGTKLPPVRDAAFSLGCAPGTVSRAYAALQARRLTHAQVGRGTFVGEGPQANAIISGDAGDDAQIDLSRNAFMIEPAHSLLGEAFSAIASRIAERHPPERWVGAMGWEPDREAALGLIRRWRDNPTVGGVALTSGAQAGIAASIAAFVPSSGALACDTLTYQGVMAAARALGRKVVALPGDEKGMTPEALEAACDRHAVSAVILMPTIHNPTGQTMPLDRREELVAVAERRDLTILEDEVYGFFRDEGAVSLSQLAPDRTVLIVSLSKCVSLVLRVGYVAGPDALVRRVAAAHNALNLMLSPMLSSAAAHILAEGRLERHIAAMRAKLSERADYIVSRAPDLDRFAAECGIVWLTLPEAWRPVEFCTEAKELGVLVAAGREFAVESHAAPNAVRVSVAAAEREEQFRSAFETLLQLRDTPYTAEVIG